MIGEMNESEYNTILGWKECDLASLASRPWGKSISWKAQPQSRLIKVQRAKMKPKLMTVSTCTIESCTVGTSISSESQSDESELGEALQDKVCKFQKSHAWANHEFILPCASCRISDKPTAHTWQIRKCYVYNIRYTPHTVSKDADVNKSMLKLSDMGWSTCGIVGLTCDGACNMEYSYKRNFEIHKRWYKKQGCNQIHPYHRLKT